MCVYNYYRTYDPSTGRYLESDPIGLVGGTNTYLYALNSPTHLVGPKGLYGQCAVWPIGTASRVATGAAYLYRAYSAARAARAAQAAAAVAVASTIPGDTPDQNVPPLPFPIPGANDLNLPRSDLFEGISGGEDEFQCFEECAAAYRVGMAACFQLYGTDQSMSGIAPSDERLSQCTWIVNETFKICTDRCADNCPE